MGNRPSRRIHTAHDTGISENVNKINTELSAAYTKLGYCETALSELQTKYDQILKEDIKKLPLPPTLYKNTDFTEDIKLPGKGGKRKTLRKRNTLRKRKKKLNIIF